MAAQLQLSKQHRKAVFSIDVTKAPSSLSMRKGTACSTLKREGSSRSSAFLVTARNVVEDGVDSLTRVSSTRFCRKYPNHEGNHCINQIPQPWKIDQFCFIPLETSPPKYCLELVSSNKLHEAQPLLRGRCDCLSYTFAGNTFKTMRWKFSEEEDTYVLTEVHPPADFVQSACRGSPVVSTEDDHLVIGVVDCTLDGDLYLLFFTESALKDQEERARGTAADRDVTDSPLEPPNPRQEQRAGLTGGRDVTGSPLEQRNPLQGQLGAAGVRSGRDVTDSPLDQRNPMREQRAGLTGGRDVTGPPLEQRNPLQEQRGAAGVRSGRDVTDSPLDQRNPMRELNAALNGDPTPPQNQERSDRSEETQNNSKQTKCIWLQEVKNLEGFDHLLTSVLKINLDPKRPLGGDYGSLAAAFGKDMKYVWFLGSKGSPVEVLLRQCNPTLQYLKELLVTKGVDRPDVANEIENWVKGQRCNCEKCGSLC